MGNCRLNKDHRNTKVYIIILNWNRWADTLECLESVFRCTHPHFQVILCDNDSQDASVQHFQRWAAGDLNFWGPSEHPLRQQSFPPVPKPIACTTHSFSEIQTNGVPDSSDPLIILRTGANLGYAGGNNAGLTYAQLRNDAHFVWVLNNDTVVEATALSAMLEQAQVQHNCGLFGSQLLFYDAPETIQATGGYLNPWLAQEKQLDSQQIEHDASRNAPRKHLIGASLLLRSETLQTAGFIDESYFMYREETDWCLTARLQGWEGFYCAASKVWHKESISLQKKSEAQDYYLVRNLLFLIYKFYPLCLPTALVGLAFQVLLPKLIRWQPQRLKSVLWAYRDFFLGRRGPLKTTKESDVQKVLVYRFGSLGDTLIALPCFHLIRQKYPKAEICLLTNFPVHSRAPAAQLILKNTGLVDRYMEYPPGMKDLKALAKLRSKIRAWSPDVGIYLTMNHDFVKTWRDFLFFKACGLKKLIGLPHAQHLRENPWLPKENCHEAEASRLLRCLSPLGTLDINDPASWQLHLASDEQEKAARCLGKLSQVPRFVCSVGTKMQANDWGETNWVGLIQTLSRHYPHFGLIFIGSPEDDARSEKLSSFWKGPTVNTCGQLSPRESAALVQGANLYIGHDSGPLHVAATMQVPCVGIFSARIKPGVWFPQGPRNRVVYHQTDCYDCELQTCIQQQKKCITSITVDEVVQTIQESLTTEPQP